MSFNKSEDDERHPFRQNHFWMRQRSCTMNTMKKFATLAVLILLACAGAPETVNEPAAAAQPDYEAKLEEMGITLAEPAPPVANYVNAVTTGNLVFMAGKGPRQDDGSYITGKLGADLTVEQGYKAARLTAINQLAALKAEIGNLNRVKRIVKVTGMVNSDPSFFEQPAVINGFSDLMVEVFGDAG